MYFVYSLLLTLGFVVLAPRFLFDALGKGKYVAGFRERLGSLSPIPNNARPVIWLHCVSVGETQAARPLLAGLKERFPDHSLVVSTITSTGQKLARDLFKDQTVKIFYFPFDWRWTARRALNAIGPSLVLIMETEVWPGFLHECQTQQIPVGIVNGRLSERSFRRYRLIKSFITRVLQCLDFAIMQTEADAERLCRLGLNERKIFVSGNLKFDAGTIPAAQSLTEEFRLRFNLNGSPLILAASTHDPEEGIVLEAFQQARLKSGLRPRLLIAPRHPERFAAAAAHIEASRLSWARRTTPPLASDSQCDVILLDTIGELPALYPLATIVFVGGSIAKTGGHNILEPAAVGACIVTGPNTFNFEAIVRTFRESDAFVQLLPSANEEVGTELAQVFLTLLADPQRRQELGRKAKELVNKNLGSTKRTLELLTANLSHAPTTPEGLPPFPGEAV
jgi:3-deoxy-D-manno-octulosonic-acid transferase